jgi:hypothetical protein
MKIQKYHTVVKVQKSNKKIVERNKMDTPNTNKAVSLLDTDIDHNNK